MMRWFRWKEHVRDYPPFYFFRVCVCVYFYVCTSVGDNGGIIFNNNTFYQQPFWCVGEKTLSGCFTRTRNPSHDTVEKSACNIMSESVSALALLRVI